MAENVNIRKNCLAIGREIGLEGQDLANYVTINAEKEMKLAHDKAIKEKEIEKEIKEKEIQGQIRERELQTELEIQVEKTKQMELARGNGMNEVGTMSTDPTVNSNHGLEQSLAFPMECFCENDPEPLDQYLDRFESLAQAHALPLEKYALKLSLHLRNSAFDIYSKLPPNRKQDYEHLKETLLRHFEINAEAYRRKFRTMRKDRNETFSQLCDRLHLCLEKWLQLSEMPQTYEGLFQLIISEQLREAMPLETQRFVKSQGATNLKQLICFADRYTEANETERGSRKPNNGNHQKVHNGPHQQQVTSEFARGDRTPHHTAKSNTNMFCTYCKTKHHSSWDCRKANKKTHKHNVAGSVTQSKGLNDTDMEITRRDFPAVVRTVKVNGHSVECLLDTGFNYHCMVSKHLVSPEQITEDSISIQYASLDVPPVEMKIAKIRIESEYVVGEIPAVVATAPVYDVILGCRYVFLGTPKEPMHVPKQPIHVCPVETRSQTKEADETVTRALNPAPGEMKAAQQDDVTLKGCFAKLPHAQDPPQVGNFIVHKNLLYRQKVKGQKQLVIPQQYRQQVLEIGHDSPFSGHNGQGATVQRITAHFYWPGINEDIKRYVRSCPVCQKKSQRSYVVPVTLGEMPVIGTPFQRLAADIIGPLPQTKKRNRFILTVVDTSTMWPEAIPLPRIDAKTVAEAFIGIFTRLGFPHQILTDNGSQFCGKLMKDVYHLLQTQHITTSVYHPAANGQVERFNGTLTAILKKLVDSQPDTWDLFVNPALYSYRAIPHASTGYAPATLLFGRPIAGPLDALKRTWTEEKLDETERMTSQYVQELKNRLTASWAIAKQTLMKARKRQSRYYNKHAKDRELQIGEKVLLLLPSGNNKLEISYQGPYPVTGKISRTNYSVEINGKTKHYHINLLKKFHEREPRPYLMGMVVAEEVESTSNLALDYPIHGTETYQDVLVNPNLTESQKDDVQRFLTKFTPVLTDLPGRTNLVEVDLTVTDPTPIRCKPYPVPLAKEKILENEINSMVESGIISPSESPYSAPVILLRKPSGEHRMCVDYRKLNAVTQFNPQPLPEPGRLFAKLSKARWFSKIDLSKGYYQIPVPKHVRKYLAFSVHKGHYEFNVLPFGLHNAPSIFSRMMQKLLAPVNNDNILHYMDDILIATATWQQHIQALTMLFNRLRETGLTARPSKCVLGVNELSFLGHHLTEGQMTPDEKNVEKMRNAPRPITKKDVRSFLGLCGFYQRFIHNFNVIAAPLSELTKKAAPEKVNWTQACEEAFQMLKERLTSKPILRLPDPTKPFVLRTDACRLGIGATLFQRDEQNPSMLHPVAFSSRKLNAAEQNYATVEQECLALVWAINKYQMFLYGKHFTVQCDNQPMLFLASAQQLNAKLMRWSLLLQQYSFQVEYIKGSQNHGADYLSRHAVDEPEGETPSISCH